MISQGFDRAVAEANGFRIEVDRNGVEQSVPVTAEAKAVMAKASAAQAAANQGQVSPAVTVEGNCGTATITAGKLANDVVSINTGYSVYLPVSQRFWEVYATGTWSGFTYPFTNVPTSGSWYATVAGIAVGPGWAGVSGGSGVIMKNGQWCVAYLPVTWFG